MRVTTKGQVTIPQPIREQLGVSAGDDVEFVRDGDQVVVRKVAPADDSPEARRRRMEAWVNAVAGSADDGWTTDEILDWTRGPERRDPNEPGFG